MINIKIGHRIHVIGTSGSGKTYLASQISKHTGIPHIELDSYYWGPNWQEPDREEFRIRLKEILETDKWVVDGNYSLIRDLIWQRANTLIWLDYSMPIVLTQLIRRTIKRTITKEILWNDNREHLSAQFFSKDSLILYAIRTHRARKRKYNQLTQNTGQIQVVHLQRPKEAQQLINQLAIETSE